MKKQKFIAMLFLLVITVSFFTGCIVKAETPAVKEGRFDFSVTYEVNGEVTTYSGVYVCEFVGVYVMIHSKGRDWDGYIENANGETSIEIQRNEDGVIYLSFGFSPEYFMSDPEFEVQGFETPRPELYMVYHSADPNMSTMEGGQDLMDKYGVRLLDYTYAEPIENTYEEKWTKGTFEPGIN